MLKTEAVRSFTNITQMVAEFGVLHVINMQIYNIC